MESPALAGLAAGWQIGAAIPNFSGDGSAVKLHPGRGARQTILQAR